MPTRRTRTVRRPRPPQATDALTAIQQRFSRLRDLRSRIAAVKPLYQQYDALLQELLPLFITKDDTGTFTVKRQISLGAKTYRLTPYFLDERTGLVRAKVWKSAAHETFAIE